jgi:hypothetical protein
MLDQAARQTQQGAIRGHGMTANQQRAACQGCPPAGIPAQPAIDLGAAERAAAKLIAALGAQVLTTHAECDGGEPEAVDPGLPVTTYQQLEAILRRRIAT